MQQSTSISDHDARELRAAVFAGAGVSLIPHLFFLWPFGAWPLQSMILIESVLAGGFIALFLWFARDRESMRRALITKGLPGLSLPAACLLALWAWIRWRSMHLPSPFGDAEPVRISAQGRPLVVAYMFIPVGMFTGIALSAVARARRAARADAICVTMTFLLAGFAALAVQQRLFGYQNQLSTLGEEMKTAQGVSEDVARGIIHALGSGRVGGRLGNGNIFAASLAVPGLFAVRALSMRRRPLIRILAVAALLTGTIAVIFTGSRGGMLTWIAALASGFLLLRIRARFMVPAAASSALLLAVLSFGPLPAAASDSPAASPEITKRETGWAKRLGDSATIRERLYYWNVARNVWSAAPVVGSGPGAFQLLYARHQVAGSRESRYSHSWFFQTGAELGTVGLGLFAIVAAGIVAAGLRSLRDPESDDPAGPVSVQAAAGCGLLLFNGLFEYSMQTREFLFLFGVLAGVALSAGADGSDDAKSEKPVPKGRKAASPRRPYARLLTLVITLQAICAAAATESARLALGEFHEWEARFAAQAGEFDVAESEYMAASRWLPDHEALLTARAMVIARDPQRRIDALEIVGRARELNPLSAGVRRSEAWLLEALGRTDEALRSLNDAVLCQPNDAGVRIARAELLLRMGEPGLAAEDVREIEERGLPLWQESVGDRPSQQALFDALRAVVRNDSLTPT